MQVCVGVVVGSCGGVVCVCVCARGGCVCGGVGGGVGVHMVVCEVGCVRVELMVGVCCVLLLGIWQ